MLRKNQVKIKKIRNVENQNTIGTSRLGERKSRLPVENPRMIMKIKRPTNWAGLKVGKGRPVV